MKKNGGKICFDGCFAVPLPAFIMYDVYLQVKCAGNDFEGSAGYADNDSDY